MKSRMERVLSLLSEVRAGEGKGAMILLFNVFLLLLSYYLLKSVREALILTEGNSEIRSYSVAVQAGIIFLLLPIYTKIFSSVSKLRVVTGIKIFFAINLLFFFISIKMGYHVGIPFFIWLGIFSVIVLSQFWAFTADLYNSESGSRLMVIIAVGGSLGALAGSHIASSMFSILGVDGIIILSMVILLVSVIPYHYTERHIPKSSRKFVQEQQEGLCFPLKPHHCFKVVFSNKFLFYIAIFVLLLNSVNSIGEYMLAESITKYANQLVAADASLDKGAIIGSTYGKFFGWVNLLSLSIQLFAVSRIFRLIGLGGAIFILPIFAFTGYAMLSFVPIFTIITIVKAMENGIDYSLQNTTKHALFLHTDRQKTFIGKTTIETLFMRLGDVLQAAIIGFGIHYAGFGIREFAMTNVVLASIWLFVTYRIVVEKRKMTEQTPAEHIEVHGEPALDSDAVNS